MSNIIKLEIRKMFDSVKFKVTVIVGIIMAMLQSFWSYNNIYRTNSYIYKNVLENGDLKMDFFETGILECWLGCETFSSYNQMWIKLFPLFAVVPYAISFFEEWNSGYSTQFITRCGRKKYIIGKSIVTFVSGGIGVVIPLIFSLLVAMLYVPCVPVELRSMQTFMYDRSMWADLFFSQPVVYALAYTLLIDFVFGGIYALFTMVLSGMCKNRFICILFPFVFHLFLSYSVTAMLHGFVYVPEAFLNPAQLIGLNSMEFGVIFCIEVATILFFCLTNYLRFRKADDLR